MFSFIDRQYITHAYLDLLLGLVPVGDDAPPADLVDDRRLPWKDGQAEAMVLIEVEH